MTPERLRKLADSWIGFAHKDPQTVVNAIESMNALNEYADALEKCEPVYQLKTGLFWCDVSKQEFNDVVVAEKRILYTAPKVAAVKVPDETIDDCPPNHFCKAKGMAIHLPTGEACDYCGYEPKIVEVK